MHTIVPFVILVAISRGSLIAHVPRWFCFLQAYAYFAYRMLDEMDGKQARRTQNSSPLGLIFDHGCDCFAMGLQTIIFFIVAQVGNNKLCYLNIVISMAGFHFCTLEEYYLGILELPPLNGVSDGSIIIIIFYIVNGIIGNEKMALNVRPGEWLHIDGIKQLTVGQIFVFP